MRKYGSLTLIQSSKARRGSDSAHLIGLSSPNFEPKTLHNIRVVFLYRAIHSKTLRMFSIFADAKTVAKAYDCKYTETSGALNHNVDELLVGILKQIRLKLAEKSKGSSRAEAAASGNRRKLILRTGAKSSGTIHRLRTNLLQN